MQIIGESAIAAQCPAVMQKQVLHSTLIKNSLLLILAPDIMGPEGFIKVNNMSPSVNCSSEEENNDFYSKFTADGKVIDECNTQFWGAIFGVVTDKFGIRWMFNFDKN